MRWPDLLEAVGRNFRAPDGYTLEQLAAADVGPLAEALARWYPDIAVGAESVHLDPTFYETHCFLRGGDSDRPIFCFVFRHSGSIVAMATIEKNDGSLTVISRMGAAAPEHRNQGLANTAPIIIESLARKMGAELLYHVVTLKSAHQQRVAEKYGYVLAGIIPAHDRDLIAPGTIRRVYEALYIKVLVPDEAIALPPANALTERTRAAWLALFGSPAP
jgi:hypothetical protein